MLPVKIEGSKDRLEWLLSVVVVVLEKEPPLNEVVGEIGEGDRLVLRSILFSNEPCSKGFS